MTGYVAGPVAQTGVELTTENLDQILREIAKYDVELESDPTQPHLGNVYLQQVIAKCRAYQNRVQYYIQIVKRYEKQIRMEMRTLELNLELKMRGLLADDPIVRKQPSVRDREAVAATMLKDDFDAVAVLKVQLVDVEDTVKLIRSKYEQLKQTSQDIRMQRTLIKDDKEAQMLGGDGYVRPTARQDRSIPNGMPAPVRPRIEPTDLLDPSKRPDDMPEPIDAGHAAMMAGFLNSHPMMTILTTWVCGTCQEEVKLNPTFACVCSKGHKATCPACGDQQFFSPNGPYCNVHGETETVMVGGVDVPKEPEPNFTQTKTLSYRDLLGD